jgi:tRNA_anti-like
MKKILLFGFIIAIVASIVGFFFYNKGPKNIKNQTGIKISATDLYINYIKDSITANKNYSEKIIEVTGLIIGISQNQQMQTVLLLQTNEPGASINCTLEEEKATLKKGDAVILKGICNGLGEGDKDLGLLGDVYLIRCYAVN